MSLAENFDETFEEPTEYERMEALVEDAIGFAAAGNPSAPDYMRRFGLTYGDAWLLRELVLARGQRSEA